MKTSLDDMAMNVTVNLILTLVLVGAAVFSAPGCGPMVSPERDANQMADAIIDTGAIDTGVVDVDVPVVPVRPFRVAMVSDCHVLPLGVDDDPNFRVAALLDDINRAAETPAAVFVLGDNIEDMFVWHEECVEGSEVPAIAMFKQIFERLDMPWYVLLGNHDTRFLDTFLGFDAPLGRWFEYFDGTDHLPATYYSVDINGFRFVALFSSDGAVDHETNDTNILLDGQVQWLNDQLDDGLPTILLYHIWLDPPASTEVPDMHPIFQAVVDHPGVVRAAFSGHGHHFLHYRFGEADFYQVGAAKYADAKDEAGSANDHAEVVLDPATGMVTLANYDFIPWDHKPAAFAP